MYIYSKKKVGYSEREDRKMKKIILREKKESYSDREESKKVQL